MGGGIGGERRRVVIAKAVVEATAVAAGGVADGRHGERANFISDALSRIVDEGGGLTKEGGGFAFGAVCCVDLVGSFGADARDGLASLS